MAVDVADVGWRRGEDLDIHVLRGRTSRHLVSSILVRVGDVWHSFASTGPTPLPANHGVSVEFIPMYDVNTPPAGVDFYDGKGVKVHRKVGTVQPYTPVSPLQPPFLRSFILKAEVKHSGTVIPSPTDMYIRIHIHEELKRIWLSPAKYEGHIGAENVKLSVLAEFGDQTIGDVTDWGGALAWSTDPVTQSVHFPFLGGGFKFEAPRVLAPIKVKVKTIAPAGFSAEAEVTTTNEWSTSHDVVNIKVRGPAADHRNVLFLSEGFGFLQEQTFIDLVKKVVADLTNKRDPTRPFDLFAGEINWWAAFVPSNDAGVSVLSEVAGVEKVRGGTRAASPIGTPREPDFNLTKDWPLEQIIFEVGLPVPTEDAATVTLSAKMSDWHTLYGPRINESRAKKEFKNWLKLRDRTLVNEVDTAFGLGVGDRPNVTDAGTTVLTFNPRRLSKADFDRFLVHLKFPGQGSLPADPTIGHNWSTGEAQIVPRGKDANLVCFIARTLRSAGTNTGDYLTTAMSDEFKHQLLPTSGKELDVNPATVPSKIELGMRATLAHELGHTFALADEYGDAMGFPDSDIAESRAKGNVQARKDLLSGGALKGDTIKWKWNRIRTAAVAKKITRVGTTLPVVLRVEISPTLVGRDRKDRFGKDDKVRLRTQPLVPTHTLSDVFVVDEAPDYRTDPVNLLLRHVGSGTVDLGPFSATPQNPIVFAPVFDGTTEVLLLHPDIVSHITSENRPLNAKPKSAVATWTCVRDENAKQKALTLPAGLKRRKQPKDAALIVGLYDGGRAFHCGIYHPTGTCLMRDAHEVSDRREIYALCPVCQYVLIDRFNPAWHGTLDIEYSKIYPK